MKYETGLERLLGQYSQVLKINEQTSLRGNPGQLNRIGLSWTSGEDFHDFPKKPHEASSEKIKGEANPRLGTYLTKQKKQTNNNNKPGKSRSCTKRGRKYRTG